MTRTSRPSTPTRPSTASTLSATRPPAITDQDSVISDSGIGDRLARRGVVADLYIFGGAAMALAYDVFDDR